MTNPAPQEHRSRLLPDDPTYLRLRDATARRLSASLQRLVRELRGAHQTEQHTALADFITRQTAILQEAYIASYKAGAKDYYGETSMDAGHWAEQTPVNPQRMRQALAFYAPSIAKMAHQALGAVNAAPGMKLDELIAQAQESIKLGFGFGGLVRGAYGERAGRGGGRGGMIGNDGRRVVRDPEGHYHGSTKGEGKNKSEEGGKRGLAGREGGKGETKTLVGKRPMTARQRKAEESPNTKATRKAPSVKEGVKAKPSAVRVTKASRATAEQRRGLDEATAPRTRTVAQRKAEAEARLGKADARVKTAEKAVKTSQKNLDDAGVRAEKMRQDNKIEIDKAQEARNTAHNAMWRNLDAVKGEVLEKAARDRAAAGYNPNAWAKMQEAERAIPGLRENLTAAEHAAKAADAHYETLKNAYMPHYKIFDNRSNMNYAEHDRMYREHKDLKAAQRESFRTSSVAEKAKYALWRQEGKYDTNRRKLSGLTEKKFQSAIDAHPSRSVFVKAHEEAVKRITELTGEGQHREAFLAHQRAQSELNAAKQEQSDAKAMVEHPAWQYEFHSEALHAALYQNLHSWEPHQLAGAHAVDNGAGSNQKNVKVGDQSLQYLQHIQGFDGHADRVSEQELALHAKAGELEIWRGDTSQAHVDDLLTGAYHPGYGIYGNGTYFQEAAREGKITAMSYANKHSSGPKAGQGRIYHATIKQGARIIEFNQLKQMAHDHIAKEETALRSAKADRNEEGMASAKVRLWVAKSDLGRFATALGYDAIRNHSNGQVIVLNRSALRISTQLFAPTAGVTTR